jgi:hypothetical protein
MGQVGNQFQSSDGRWHDSANDANDANLQSKAGGGGSGGAGSMAAAGGNLAAIFGVIVIVVAIIVVRYFWYFFLIGAVLFSRSILLKLYNKIPLLEKARSNVEGKVPFIARSPKMFINISFIIIFILGLMLVGNHYKYALDKALLSSDKIIAYEDGSAPGFYRSLNGAENQAKTNRTMTVGETVTIKGINRARTAYTIVTADGKKGWVSVYAFRNDARPAKFTIMGKAMGADSWAAQVVSERRNIESIEERIAELEPNLASMMTKVSIVSELLNENGNGTDLGWLEIKGILYLDDYTVLDIEHSEYDIGNLYDNRHGGKGSYFLEDEELRKNYMVGHTYYQNAEGKTCAYLFFSKFTSKNFNLINSNHSYEGRRNSSENILGAKVQ